MELNFCRRCGEPLTNTHEHVFRCNGGHVIYQNPVPAVEIVLVNDNHEAMIVTRKEDPGKGKLDLPGGFCDAAETFEEALGREIAEELNLKPGDYETPQYLMSCLDNYEYQGETLTVISAAFWAKIKPSAKAVANDDVSDITFLPFHKIDLGRIQFKGQIGVLKKLHDTGIIQ